MNVNYSLTAQAKWKLRTMLLSNATKEMIRRVKASRLTYLTDTKLFAIAYLTKNILKNKIPGSIIETGCALGGSAILMASMKEPDRQIFIYDVFGMIPPPSTQDEADVHNRYNIIKSGKSRGIDGDQYYGYEDNLIEKVRKAFFDFNFSTEDNNIYLIQGLIQDTLSVSEPVSLAHIDVDWYDPVLISLERITPYLSKGGAIVIDDYFDWSGCKKATDEFFRDKLELFEFDSSMGSLVVIKK